MTLPPGQHAIEGFPRFGTHLHNGPPAVPERPEIAIGGEVLTRSATLDVADLRSLPRTRQTSDFHCVAGWSATGLEWEGVEFATLFRTTIEPALREGAAVSHVVFGGLDGFRSVVRIEDALNDDVLVADRLNREPLDLDHGAPVRLVSPGQYGYISTKHLSRIELHASEPANGFGTSTSAARLGLRLLGFSKYGRARVWEEERGGYLPNAVARPVYRLLAPALRAVSARGSRPGEQR